MFDHSRSFIKIIFLLLSILLLTVGCNFFEEKHKEEPLARVYDEYLYPTDLLNTIPKGTSPEDSTVIIKNHINNWIQQQLILATAKNNLIDEQKNFEKQLNEYRNSLIIYTYESELIRQKLDINITDKEIDEYYENNSKNFLLRDNIVKVVYVKTPHKTTNLNKIKKLYKEDDEDKLIELKDLCEREAINFFLDDIWLYFNDLLKEVPIKTYNQEEFLKNNRFIEMQDSLYYYFLNIKGFKIKESVSPLSMERENIKSILLNTRKLNFINETHDKIYDDALKNNDFEIYY